MSGPLWSVDDAFAAFEARTNYEKRPFKLRNLNLARMEALLARLGRPHEALQVVHVAGSKGKGSTVALAATLLAQGAAGRAGDTPEAGHEVDTPGPPPGAGGARVGVYLSPHVSDYRERITIIEPGDALDLRTVRRDAAYERLIAEATAAVQSAFVALERDGTPDENLPTTFELLTAAAFEAFRRARCDWVVLETGLGGRLDATNVCLPRATAITRIELEHTEILGDTRALIAAEKAGIVKRRVPLIVAPQTDEAFGPIAARADELAAPLRRVTGEEVAATGALIAAEQLSGRIPLPNDATNLAVARALVDAVAPTPLSDRAVAAAYRATYLPARGEIVGRTVLDGAHTEESLRAVGAAFHRCRGAAPGVVIFGLARGKEPARLAPAIADLALPVVVSRAGTFRPADPEEVFDALRRVVPTAELVVEPDAALERARALAGADGWVLVAGSFYLAGAIRALLVDDGAHACR